MTLDFKNLIKKYGINPKGVIQLGTHYWQEKPVFVSMGINDFVLVEPQKEPFAIMKSKTSDVNAIAINCAVSDIEACP